MAKTRLIILASIIIWLLSSCTTVRTIGTTESRRDSLHVTQTDSIHKQVETAVRDTAHVAIKTDTEQTITERVTTSTDTVGRPLVVTEREIVTRYSSTLDADLHRWVVTMQEELTQMKHDKDSVFIEQSTTYDDTDLMEKIESANKESAWKRFKRQSGAFLCGVAFAILFLVARKYRAANPHID